MKMINLDDDRRRFEELVPFYVNKTLQGEELAFVESYLLQHPNLKSEVWFWNSIMDAMNLHSQNCDAFLSSYKPPKTAIERFKEMNRKKSPWDKLVQWSKTGQSLAMEWQWMPALTVSFFCLLVGQSIYLVNLQNEASKYRGIVSSVNIVPHFKVTVSPKADFYDLADLLRKNGCNVVSGPSQNGELWVKLDEPAKSKQIKADLLNSGLVDEVISVSPAVE